MTDFVGVSVGFCVSVGVKVRVIVRVGDAVGDDVIVDVGRMVVEVGIVGDNTVFTFVAAKLLCFVVNRVELPQPYKILIENIAYKKVTGS